TRRPDGLSSRRGDGGALTALPRRPGSTAASEPATLERRATQSLFQVGAAAHDLPDQSGPVVLDHEDHWTLVDSEVIRGDPPSRGAVRHRIGLVERGLEAVTPGR